MPRITNSTGKRPEYIALELFRAGATVTPSEIDKYVGTGTYSSKYMSFLKRDGFVISIKKDGRSVVSYTLVSSPPDEKLPSGAFEKQKVAAKKSTPKVKVKVAANVEETGFVLPQKKAAAKKSHLDSAEQEFGNTGEFSGGSYSIDGDFDKVDPRELF